MTDIGVFHTNYWLPWWLKRERICLQCGKPGSDLCVGKILWRKARQPILIFLPGESPWTEEPGRLQGMLRIWHDWVTKNSTYNLHLISPMSLLSLLQLFVTTWTIVHQCPRPWGFSRQDTGAGCHALLEGIFLTQGSNPGLLDSRWIL